MATATSNRRRWRAQVPGPGLRLRLLQDPPRPDGSTYEEWHWFSCAMAQPDGSWPPLQIQHRRLVDKALELVGGDPIHFESEEFNETFHVTCDDRRFASALIDPQMMQFLLETKGMVSFATMGRFVLVTSPQVAPDEMPILLGLVDEFVRRIPAAVWELYPETAPDGPPEPVVSPVAPAPTGQLTPTTPGTRPPGSTTTSTVTRCRPRPRIRGTTTRSGRTTPDRRIASSERRPVAFAACDTPTWPSWGPVRPGARRPSPWPGPAWG